jgi:hypothetical protein
MATYKVFLHPQLGVQAVKVGFAWNMLIGERTLLATQRKTKLLKYALALLIAVDVLVLMRFGFSAFDLALSANAAVIALCVVPNLNAWHEALLLEQGYRYHLSLESDDVPGAIAKFNLSKSQ